MARIINGKTIPTDITSKSITAKTPAGEQEEIMRIDTVDEFINTGDVETFLRVSLYDQEEQVINTHYFDVDNDYILAHSYIQTTEANQRLLNKLIMLIQGKTTINEFINEISSSYFMKDLGYSQIKMEQ
jgi:hypothetical protein